MSALSKPALRLPADTARKLGVVAELPEHLQPLLARVGRRLSGHYNKSEAIEVVHKTDQSPVTEADHDAHALLLEGLTALTPEIPVLSEESPEASIADRRSWDTSWIVDPLDGTREFIEGTGEFTVNVALVHRHRPVLGIISVPLLRQLFVGIPDVGAWLVDDATGQVEPLRVAPWSGTGPLRVLASQRHNPNRVASVLDRLRVVTEDVVRINAGSALKFCVLARGDADLYPRTSPCYEWDVAAGDALVHGAGGFLTGTDGQPLRYNARDVLLVETFLAGADDSVDWRGLLY